MIGTESGSNPVVLIVDDEALIRMPLADELIDSGFEVVEAESGDAAIAILDRGLPVRSVVTDVRMPGKNDGLALARWMARNLPSVPVVIVTGYPLDGDVRSLNPAILSVIRKPYDTAAIAQLLRRKEADRS